MARRVSAAQAKAQLSALVAEAAYAGHHIIIERRGKPLAALVSMADLERLEQEPVAPTGLLAAVGALALVGAWKELEDSDLDSLVADIYASRENEMGRPVELEG